MNIAPLVGAQARLPAAVSRGAAAFPQKRIPDWVLSVRRRNMSAGLPKEL